MHIFFIHSSVDGHLGCVLIFVLPIVNNSAMNMEMQISLQDSDNISFRYIPRSGIVNPMVVLFLVFWRTSLGFSTVFYSDYPDLPS